VSLQVRAGEYWALLGPSGCGKSMLLQTIAGFYAPYSGGVALDGRDANSDPPEARDIGLVFQQAALFPHMSVADNIAYGLRARKLPTAEREQRVGEMVELLRLERVLGRPVATLSGGEAQRVAIARAVAIRPRLLLLDEPLSLIDHNARIELRDHLVRVHRELDLTTLHVTHSREEARAVGDHIAVMVGGHIVQRGPAAEVFGGARCSFVSAFLGIDGPANDSACDAKCPARASCEHMPAEVE